MLNAQSKIKKTAFTGSWLLATIFFTDHFLLLATMFFTDH
jgi:hypothetical protein